MPLLRKDRSICILYLLFSVVLRKMQSICILHLLGVAPINSLLIDFKSP